MKKSKSMIIILGCVFLIGVIILLMVLAYNGFNVFTWLFNSQQGLLVLFAIAIIILTAFVVYYKMRDRL